MSDPVLDAAQVLAPLLAAGADGVVAEAMRQAGEGAAAGARRVLDAVRKALGGKAADREAVAAALRGELEKGAIVMTPFEIARLDNDRNFPENGVLRLSAVGGL